ncbi:hypothetical protein WR25_21674 [Diploscapter pachys]|uniref:U3 small nucleolar RNA-associated protein 14 homolog A n=1 Tax=Diploscapter pachys TaxID=2018661 RepID=A0A2A2LBV4_9BILA|nr:hypothetical protein WR25_21674 [Diploscapter pachys]
MSDSDIDDAAHEVLLQSITAQTSKKKMIRKTAPKISSDDLLDSIKTQSSALTKARRQSEIGLTVVAEKEKNKAERKEKKGKIEKKAKKAKTLPTPIHRQAREKIQSAVGYDLLKKDLSVWTDIVNSNRLADQLTFPMDLKHIHNVETAAQQAEGFTPRTEMEKEIAQILNSSKNNLTNDDVYTEAELEIIRAMNLKEAKQKLSQMQRMKALISYREAKYRYAGKIKSKSYHRILKREKRKQLVKELEELLIRDPEAAQEKLKALETQRVIERGTLKHRARNKFHSDALKYASRDSELRKQIEDHFRFGREIKAKLAIDESESEEDEGKKESVTDMIKSAAKTAEKELKQTAEERIEAVAARRYLFALRQQKRKELENARKRGAGQEIEEEDANFELDEDWEEEKEAENPEQNSEPSEPVEEPLKKKKKGKERKETPLAESQDIDILFQEAEAKLAKRVLDTADQLADEVAREEAQEDEEKQKKRKKKLKLKQKEKDAEEKKKIDEQKKQLDLEISLNPNNFLQLETGSLQQVSADLVEKIDEIEDERAKIVAEAFKDDDVIAEFEQEKEMVEEGERPKDTDLNLPGWGNWVGPGISERRKRQKFIVKAREKKRKDAVRKGVIIKENIVEKIENLQPKTLPFPYTRVQDFEAVVKQPIGKDWNTATVTGQLCRPSVVTKGGRPILPINKKEMIKKNMLEQAESSSEDDE